MDTKQKEKLKDTINKEGQKIKDRWGKNALDIAKAENSSEFDAGFYHGLKHAKKLLFD